MSPKVHALEHLTPSWWYSMKAMQPLGGGALLDQVSHWGQTLRLAAWPHFLPSLPLSLHPHTLLPECRKYFL